MLTKILSAISLFSCSFFVCHAQNEIYHFKFNPAPFDNKTPLKKQFIKPLPYINLQNKNFKDSLKPGYTTGLGEVFIDAQDGMPVLKPYPENTYYERKHILRPYAVTPFGKPSYIDPMPNPLNKALITK